DRKVRGEAGQSGEDRPPENDARENSSRSIAIGERTSRDFEYGISKRENADDPAPIGRRKAEFVLHTRAGDGDANAGEVRDHGHDGEKNKNFVAKFHGIVLGHRMRAETIAEFFKKAKE